MRPQDRYEPPGQGTQGWLTEHGQLSSKQCPRCWASSSGHDARVDLRSAPGCGEAGQVTSVEPGHIRRRPCDPTSGAGALCSVLCALCAVLMLCAELVTTFFTVSRAREARRAGGRCSTHAGAPREACSWRRSAQARPAAGRPRSASAACRVPAAFLWPCRATSAPTRRSSPRPAAQAATVTPCCDARCCKAGHPSGASS
jgi:hypothetical protein